MISLFLAWSFGCHCSKLQETVILRRSLNVSEFLAVANKHGVSWNLEEQKKLQNSGIRVDYVYSDLSFEDCLPDALPDCLDLLGKDFQGWCPANHVCFKSERRMHVCFKSCRCLKEHFDVLLCNTCTSQDPRQRIFDDWSLKDWVTSMLTWQLHVRPSSICHLLLLLFSN